MVNKVLRAVAGTTIHPFRPAAEMSAAEALDGLWTLRFGRFGCRDEETHGGVLHVEGDRMAGGDGHFLFHGHHELQGTSLRAWFQVVRHGGAPEYLGIFGDVPPIFQLEFVAEAIGPGQYEGRIERQGHPDLRILMRRFELPAKGGRIV